MSMRPQRRRTASTIATSVASTATSASNATHSPPACRAIATVSSAEEALLSTASTLAPSCTKRKAVARLAQALAGRLTGAYDDGDLVLETHANLGENSTNDTYARISRLFEWVAG